MEYTPEMLAMLERQRAHFASDDHIRRRAAPWRGVSPEECLDELAEAVDLTAMLAIWDEKTLQRALEPEPLPADTIALLRALQRP